MPDSELSKNYLVFSDNFLYHAHKIARIAVQPYHVRYKIFQLCQCQYTIKQIAFSDIKSFSCAGLFSFFFLGAFAEVTSLFKSFFVSCCSLM